MQPKINMIQCYIMFCLWFFMATYVIDSNYTRKVDKLKEDMQTLYTNQETFNDALGKLNIIVQDMDARIKNIFTLIAFTAKLPVTDEVQIQFHEPTNEIQLMKGQSK